MVTHFSMLAGKIPWMEEPGGLQSMGSPSQTRLSDFTFTFFGPGEVPALLDLSNCRLVHFFFFFLRKSCVFYLF